MQSDPRPAPGGCWSCPLPAEPSFPEAAGRRGRAGAGTAALTSCPAGISAERTQPPSRSTPGAAGRSPDVPNPPRPPFALRPLSAPGCGASASPGIAARPGLARRLIWHAPGKAQKSKTGMKPPRFSVSPAAAQRRRHRRAHGASSRPFHHWPTATFLLF